MEEFLETRLNQRKEENALRSLRIVRNAIDFCSNDYLGIATNNLLNSEVEKIGLEYELRTGSGGSRLLSGNYELIEAAELFIANFHQAESALIYNSGYDANLGLITAVATRTDTIIYDSLCHASIRDGIRLSQARAFAFQHNDLEDCEKKLAQTDGNIFLITESVFSMDGDKAPLVELASLCKRYGAQLIVDEAHAVGILGSNGCGLVQEKRLENEVFARVVTYGKAMGCHGAAVLGSHLLREFLINFSRPFIYSTSPSPVSVASMLAAYRLMPAVEGERQKLFDLCRQFRSLEIGYEKIDSETAIQAIVIPGNENVKAPAARLQDHGFDVRAVLYPTVPRGRERLRIILHSFNTSEEVQKLGSILRSDEPR